MGAGFVPEHCKKRNPKPLPSLPGIPQPGRHPGVLSCGGGTRGAPVIPLTGGSEHSHMLVPQHSMTGTQCLPEPGLTDVGEGNAKQGKGIPIKRRKQPEASTQLSRHRHIHRAHGGACQSTQGCDLCTPTWSRWEDLSVLARRRHTHVCTHVHAEGTALPLRLGLPARNHGAGGEKVSHTFTAKLKGKSLLMNQHILNFLPLGKQEILQSPDPTIYLGAKSTVS